MSARDQMWIEDRLRDVSRRKKDVADALRVLPSAVTAIIGGDRQLKAGEVGQLAVVLDMRPGEVLAKITGAPLPPGALPVEAVKIRGYVQAGEWQLAEDLIAADLGEIYVPVDPRYEHMTRFALEVRGDSMSDIYPHGTVVQCVPLAELERRPASGERVVVQRMNEANNIEATVKEFRVSKDGRMWLVPRTDQPGFEDIELPAPDPDRPTDDGGIDHLRIVALVIGSYRPE